MTARVLFVTQTAHTWGGVEEWLEYISNALAERGWKITVGLVRGRRFHNPNKYRAAHRLPATIEIAALTGTTEGRVRAVTAAIERTHADIVVPVNVADTLETARRLKARASRVRLMVPVHGLTSDYFLDVRAFRGVIDFAAAVNRLAARALVHVSGLDAERAAYAPCGVPAPREEPSFGGGILRLLFVGRLTQIQKRARDLVTLCRELDGRRVRYHLDIVGDGDELPALRDALACAPTVRFVGVCAPAVLYSDIYPGATSMVILSEWETGPLVAWEAMRHGAAIVTTDYRGRAAEGALIHDETALVAPVGDVSALASHVERLARDAGLLDRLRRAAHQKASSNYTRERSVDAWETALRSCLAANPAIEACAVPLPPVRSRLDALLGHRAGETVRGALGWGPRHSDPGGEWPHTWNVPSPEADAAIAALDR